MWQTDRRTDRRTEKTIHRAAWSQLKKEKRCLWIPWLMSKPGVGLPNQFISSIPLFPHFFFQNWQNTAYLENITFISDRHHHSSAATTTVKYESDLKDLNIQIIITLHPLSLITDPHHPISTNNNTNHQPPPNTIIISMAQCETAVTPVRYLTYHGKLPGHDEATGVNQLTHFLPDLFKIWQFASIWPLWNGWKRNNMYDYDRNYSTKQ